MDEERKEIQKAFGTVIKELRLDKNISQAKLAELGDFERTYISDLERGIKHPSLHTLIKIALALGTRPYQLMLLIEEHIKIKIDF